MTTTVMTTAVAGVGTTTVIKVELAGLAASRAGDTENDGRISQTH